MNLERFRRRGVLGGVAGALTGLAGCSWLGPSDQAETGTPGDTPDETPENTPTTSDSTPDGDGPGAGPKLQAALDGFVVPVATGLGVPDAIDPASTPTPLADATAKIDDAGGRPGHGTVLLPPTTIREAAHLVPSQFVEFLGWGVDTTTVEFTDLAADGFRITHLKDGKFVRLDGFTIHGSDRRKRTGGSAIHFRNESGVSPKQFNIGSLAFREWVDPVVHCEAGSPFDSTWHHLDFGYDANDGREIALERGQSLLGTQIGYIGAGNATNDTVLWTEFAGAKIDIGFLNIGGSAGQAVRLKAAKNGHVNIGGINFEPNLTTDEPIVSLQGHASTRIEYVQNTDSGARSMVQLSFKNGNNVIGPLLNNGSLAVRAVEITADAVSPSYYFGPSADVVVDSGVSSNLLAFGDMRRVTGERASHATSVPTSDVDHYSNVPAADLEPGEFAVDTNHDDAGAVVLLYRDGAGRVHRWDGDTVGSVF